MTRATRQAFTYSDGGTQRRIWRLTALPDGRFVGRADDVVGQAQASKAATPSLGLYPGPAGGGRVIEVQFDDWMFLMDERVMLHRATMSKWGVHLGEVTLGFIKGKPMIALVKPTKEAIRKS